MSRFPSLSAWFQRLSRRERRFVAAGAVVSTLALLSVWVALPFVRRWHDREATIAAKATQLGQLRALVESEALARSRLVEHQRDRARLRERLLTGATPALAASNVQALLQGYADRSRVTLDRVDVVAGPGSATGETLPAIPVSLSGQGDIYGISELLTSLQHGGKLLVLDELRVTGGNPSYAPDLVSFSIRLHGAYSQE
jgi:hypothetical protein